MSGANINWANYDAAFPVTTEDKEQLTPRPLFRADVAVCNWTCPLCFFSNPGLPRCDVCGHQYLVEPVQKWNQIELRNSVDATKYVGCLIARPWNDCFWYYGKIVTATADGRWGVEYVDGERKIEVANRLNRTRLLGSNSFYDCILRLANNYQRRRGVAIQHHTVRLRSLVHVSCFEGTPALEQIIICYLVEVE